jgi:DNA-binding NarL/FixJ family response regulator
MSIVRILIADDHELVRDGIRARIETQPKWRVAAQASDGRQAVELAKQVKPHVAILDIGMQELNGIEATRQIRIACPQTEILILTLQVSDLLIREALMAGAKGFMLKTDAARLLITAVETLLEKKPFLASDVSGLVLAGFLDPEVATVDKELAFSPLTPREREIVQLLAEAKSSKDAARRIGVSAKTIDAHRQNIMRKLNLHTIAELVRYAVRHKIIQA